MLEIYYQVFTSKHPQAPTRGELRTYIHTPDLAGLESAYFLGLRLTGLSNPLVHLTTIFLQAQRIRNLVRRDFDRVFRAPNVLSAHPEINQGGVDVLIHPSAIRTAPRLDEDNTGSESNLDSYLQDVPFPLHLPDCPH